MLVSKVCFVSAGTCALTRVGTGDEDPCVCTWWYGGETLSLSEVCIASAGTCGLGCAGVEVEDLAVCTWWYGSVPLLSSEARFVSVGTCILCAPVLERRTRHACGGVAARGSVSRRHALCSGGNMCLDMLRLEGICVHICTWWYGDETPPQNTCTIFEQAEDTIRVLSPSQVGEVAKDTRSTRKGSRWKTGG